MTTVHFQFDGYGTVEFDPDDYPHRDTATRQGLVDLARDYIYDNGIPDQAEFTVYLAEVDGTEVTNAEGI